MLNCIKTTSPLVSLVCCVVEASVHSSLRGRPPAVNGGWCARAAERKTAVSLRRVPPASRHVVQRASLHDARAVRRHLRRRRHVPAAVVGRLPARRAHRARDRVRFARQLAPDMRRIEHLCTRHRVRKLDRAGIRGRKCRRLLRQQVGRLHLRRQRSRRSSTKRRTATRGASVTRGRRTRGDTPTKRLRTRRTGCASPGTTIRTGSGAPSFSRRRPPPATAGARRRRSGWRRRASGTSMGEKMQPTQPICRPCSKRTRSCANRQRGTAS